MSLVWLVTSCKVDDTILDISIRYFSAFGILLFGIFAGCQKWSEPLTVKSAVHIFQLKKILFDLVPSRNWLWRHSNACTMHWCLSKPVEDLGSTPKGIFFCYRCCFWIFLHLLVLIKRELGAVGIKPRASYWWGHRFDHKTTMPGQGVMDNAHGSHKAVWGLIPDTS